MYAPRPQRATAFLGSAAIVLGLAAALILGLRAGKPPRPQSALVAVEFVPEQPPPRASVPPKRNRSKAPKDAAAPRALRNQATQIIAPPVVPLIEPPPVITAPVTGTGDAASQGASELPGPGQGAGGQGDGRGGGGLGGDGDGDGGGEGMPVVGPRQIRGKLTYRDLPPDVLQPGQQARVGVQYNVNTDGRVSGCRVDEPSGVGVADAMTCRLIEQRFVFRPARDRSGRPVRSIIVETHTWFTRDQ